MRLLSYYHFKVLHLHRLHVCFTYTIFACFKGAFLQELRPSQAAGNAAESEMSVLRCANQAARLNISPASKQYTGTFRCKKAAFQIMRPVASFKGNQEGYTQFLLTSLNHCIQWLSEARKALKWKLHLRLKMHGYFTDCFFQHLGFVCFFVFFFKYMDSN